MDFKTLSKPNMTPVDVIKNQKSKIYPKDQHLIEDLKRCIWWKHIFETFMLTDKSIDRK